MFQILSQPPGNLLDFSFVYLLQICYLLYTNFRFILLLKNYVHQCFSGIYSKYLFISVPRFN